MKTGRQSFRAERPVYVRLFDTVLSDDLWGERSYEKAESKMHREAVRGAMCLAGEERDGVDLMLAGDLLNELSASGFAMRYFKVPFAGLYNACSTFSEGMLIGTALINGGAADTVACSTSSHFDIQPFCLCREAVPLSAGARQPAHSHFAMDGDGSGLHRARGETPDRGGGRTQQAGFCRTDEEYAGGVPEKRGRRGRQMRPVLQKRRVFGICAQDQGKIAPPNAARARCGRKLPPHARDKDLRRDVRESGGLRHRRREQHGRSDGAGCGRHPHRAFRGYGHLALRLRRHINGRPRQVRQICFRGRACPSATSIGTAARSFICRVRRHFRAVRARGA